MSRARWLRLVHVIVVVGTAAIGVRGARACGGFFCSQPQPNGGLPIAQAAENVLFVMDTDPATGAKRVEAHIQILYTGPATQFSWIVPVTAVPTVDVGWDILFDRLEPPTRPSFRLNYQVEGTCKGGGGGSGIGCGQADSAALGSGGPGGVPPPPTVDVLSRGSVGPYEYVVVRSEDGATLRTWLGTNGYYVSEEAARIVDEYVAGFHSFVAVKLQVGQDTSAIRPIILRLASAEACLPLKLTAIAATPDLRINVWVLADARAIPINYVEIGVNLAKLDWINGGINYDQLLKEAANEADGNAFAVEYAQKSTTATTWFTLMNPNGRAGLSAAPDPASYMNTFGTLGVPLTSAVVQVLRKYIPMPASVAAQGVSEVSFYLSMSYYWGMFRSSFAPFDPVALTVEMEAEVLAPIDSFRSLFMRNAYLTRLATFISPEEMTKDPLFVTNRLLPDVAPNRTAIGHILCGDEEYDSCSAPLWVELEDGRRIGWLPRSCGGGGVDRSDIDAMPSGEIAWIREPDSEGQMVMDNRTAIAQTLAAHNAQVPTLDSGCGCSLRARPRSMAMLAAAATSVLMLFARRRRRGR